MISTAFAQNVQLDAPDIEMDTPSVETDMPGQGGMSQDRDLLLMEKNINDIDKAKSELAAMSAWEAPASLGEKERKEWQEQSRRLKQHADVLADLSSDLRSVVNKASSGGKVDYQQAKSDAREIINGLHNDVTTRNINSDTAVQRQQAAASTLDAVSLL